MVDVKILNETFSRTLVPSGEASRQAAHQLDQMDQQPHFVIGLLELISDSSVDMGVRRAGAVYLKNKVNRSWSTANAIVLNDTDKQIFKQRLLPVIVSSPPAIRSFLFVCLSTILNVDYMKQMWPEFISDIKSLLQQTSDLQKVSAGLGALKQLCRFYRWNLSSVSKQLGPLMSEFYPHLINIAEAAVTEVQKNGDEIYYQLIYDILKIYKLSTARFLPEIYRQEAMSKRTISLFLQVFTLPLPNTVLQLQPASERSTLLPVKCQKWSVVNITRTYNTYLTSSYSQLSENGQAYQPFRELFNNMFAPEITRIYLEQLQSWSDNGIWISDAALYSVITYLEPMINVKPVYLNLIEPQIMGLLQKVLFPLLCPSDDDLDLFLDDPSEFLQRKLDLIDINRTPGLASSSFIGKLLKKKKDTSSLIVEFLQNCSSKLQNATDEIKGRVGLFKFVKTIDFLFNRKNSILYNQLEPFLVQFVIPDLQSKHAFLRYEACDTISHTANVTYNDRNIVQALFQSIIFCFFDKEHLTVQVAAALALQALTSQPHHEDFKAGMGNHITEIISQLLHITEQIDCEPLLSVLDHFVELYPDKIGPYAVSLAEQLSRQFISLASELVEQNNALDGTNMEAESQFLTENDEKISTGLSIMNSLANLQSQLENQPQLIERLDEVISPVFLAVYQSNFLDFYQDCFSLHENSLYTLKSVPERHWQYFDLLLQFIQRTEYDYFEEAMPVIENYIAFGAKSFAQNEARLNNFVKILLGLFVPKQDSQKDTDIGSIYSDARTRAHVMSLTSRLFLSTDLFNGLLNVQLPSVVEGVLCRVGADSSTKNTFPHRYNVSTVSLILSCIYHNPKLTLEVMNVNSSVNAFMETWFGSIEEFQRVNDLKLCEISSLALLNYFSENPSIQPFYFAELVKTLTYSLEKLPGAVARENEIFQAANDGLWNDEDEYNLDDFDDENDEQDGSEAFEQEIAHGDVSSFANVPQGDSVFIHEQPGPVISHNENMNEIHESVQKFSGFITEDYDQDIYSISPLDGLNPYDALRAVLGRINLQSPDFYNQLMATESEKAIILDSLQIRDLPPLQK